ncbi:hypothetical protein BEL04_19660 [Mucilaginibacter sp. PPCGB 2223]|uniref:hypothetical protein n=1 Tax=Mucilaginibacter sp. PPCGB 2223 TaxID=1886027 RepID=UPI0008264FA1|nr:hypothetical protein [Mucilaginibacter sp. PPCGB 2223]OCX50939.1 hypothetical protein BEL04_19660 [Mucilaginibacter sp. PPCGB 2223]
MRRGYLVFLVMACLSCRSASVTEADHSRIGLSRDSQTVILGGLDYAVLQELKKDSLTAEGFRQLLAVYRMPADTDMKDYQNEQPGIYQITDSLIIFKPDTPFKKHQTYFARFYGHSTENTPARLAQGKGNLKAPKYTEEVFKF